MGRTLLTSKEIGNVQRNDLEISVSGEAVIRKAISGTGISFTSTGTDAGTGDVTINLANIAANTLLGNITGSSAAPTPTSVLTTATVSSILLRDANANAFANNFLSNYIAVTTAAGTTTLVVGSSKIQNFIGSTTQTVILPDVSTLTLGHQFEITNNSSGAITVQSSGANNIQVMAANSRLFLVSNATTGTTAAVWNVSYIPILTNVENTALSTWVGSTNITTLGTISTGTWSGTTIAINKGGTGQITAQAAIDALVPTQTGNNAKVLGTNGTTVAWQAAGSGSGITRTVVVTSVSATAGAAASTDYIYLIAGAHTMTLPTSVGNINRYTFKNNYTQSVTLLTTSSETIDGVTSITLSPESSIDLVSDNSNWRVI